MTKAKKLLFLYQQLQSPSYSNVGTYEWNGEENLPPQFILRQTVPECALKKALGDDGKYYYYVDQKSVYGAGSIQLHDSITVPETGMTEVSMVIEILDIITETRKCASVEGFVNSGRQYPMIVNGNEYYVNGATGIPTLTVGEHTLKQVINHAKNTINAYIDDVMYGTSISQYSAQVSSAPTCLCSLWCFSKDFAKIKAFRYSHAD